MAVKYTATIDVNVWKEHTCASCAGRYRYLLKRKATGQASDKETASRNARQAVLTTLEQETDKHACPGCGLIQPDMIAPGRATGHWCFCAAAGVVVAVFLYYALSSGALPASMAWLLAGSGVLLLAANAALDLRNPNSDREANRRRAEMSVEKGALWQAEEGRARDLEPVGNGWSGLHTAACLLMAAGVVAAVVPEVARVVAGWPLNATVTPQVAGPGSELYVTFPESITCVKGMWSGSGQAAVTNAAEVGLPAGTTLPLTSSTDTWGGSIRVKSSEKNSSRNPWCKVQLPADAALGGKTLELAVDLKASWPQIEGTGFSTRTGSYRRTASVQLAPAGAASTYWTLSWGSFLFACLAFTGGPALLAVAAGRYRRQALPTSIHVPEVPGEAQGTGEEDGLDARTA